MGVGVSAQHLAWLRLTWLNQAGLLINKVVSVTVTEGFSGLAYSAFILVNPSVL